MLHYYISMTLRGINAKFFPLQCKSILLPKYYGLKPHREFSVITAMKMNINLQPYVHWIAPAENRQKISALIKLCQGNKPAKNYT
jgi:hypothetical protein